MMTQTEFDKQIEAEKIRFKKQVAKDIYELRKRLHNEEHTDLYSKIKILLKKVWG
jgi:hypothetical protein